MNSKSLRRLAADFASLHSAGLPPNYLFPLDGSDLGSDLTQLDVILAGPEGTPYSNGVFKLHLTIPANYPTAPPTAAFKTRIFHPNVEESTGSVCVDTLKRDWSNKVTLRDILVTISCLLIQPNPASALNAEAGMLVEGDWSGFEKRARLMTEIHAPIPSHLKEAVQKAKGCALEEQTVAGAGKDKTKGNDKAHPKVTKSMKRESEDGENLSRAKRRETISDSEADWIPQPTIIARPMKPFVLGSDNIFGIQTPENPGRSKAVEVLKPNKEVAIVKPAAASSSRDALFQSGPTKINLPNPFGHNPLSTPINAPLWLKKQAVEFATPPSASSLISVCSDSIAGRMAPPSSEKRLAKIFGEPTAPVTDSSCVTNFFDTWTWMRPPAMNDQASETVTCSKQERSELRRLKASGNDLKKYNKGHWGPRRGLRRL